MPTPAPVANEIFDAPVLRQYAEQYLPVVRTGNQIDEHPDRLRLKSGIEYFIRADRIIAAALCAADDHWAGPESTFLVGSFDITH